MEYTQQQKDDFKRQFALRRKRQLILAAPIILFMLLMIWTEKGSGSVAGVPAFAFAPVAFVVVLGGVLFSLRNWRCPACNRYLGKGMNPSFCPRCGVALQ
jgi:hypothetical protein